MFSAAAQQLGRSVVGEAVAEQEVTAPPRIVISNEEELKAYLKQRFGVVLPDTQVCPNHSTPFRAFADSYFARDSVVVWEASRGFGGKTFMLSVLGVTEAETLGADVNILGGSGEQSQRVNGYMNAWWDLPSTPEGMLAGNTGVKVTKLSGGNRVVALMASSRSVRGPHPQRLRVDEADEIKLEIFDSAMGQPMSGRGVEKQTTVSSTHQYADGTMTEIKKRIRANGYLYHEWCYKECLEPWGWLALKEVESKKREVTTAMWENEYELQEPSPGNRAIEANAVKRMFREDLGRYRGENGELIIIEKPQPGGKYVTGADWAKKRDWTIVVTIRFDCYPYRVVAFRRLGRREWPHMVAEFDNRLEMYGGIGYHDGTGIGDVVAGYIKHPAQGIIMVGMKRRDLLTNYINGVEKGMVDCPFIEWMESEHRTASYEDVYSSAENSHLPDTISAMACAWEGVPHNYISGPSAWLEYYRGEGAGQDGEVKPLDVELPEGVQHPPNPMSGWGWGN